MVYVWLTRHLVLLDSDVHEDHSWHIDRRNPAVSLLDHLSSHHAFSLPRNVPAYQIYPGVYLGYPGLLNVSLYSAAQYHLPCVELVFMVQVCDHVGSLEFSSYPASKERFSQKHQMLRAKMRNVIVLRHKDKQSGSSRSGAQRVIAQTPLLLLKTITP